ncbi:hypothetical protein [Sphingomonas sp.]|jgi:hypothetical protein|uniref:hypothetical protein n=1 Tax=Sphingomonas sp. TaxID=28214 RepID=UPI0035646D2A
MTAAQRNQRALLAQQAQKPAAPTGRPAVAQQQPAVIPASQTRNRGWQATATQAVKPKPVTKPKPIATSPVAAQQSMTPPTAGGLASAARPVNRTTVPAPKIVR